MLTQMVYISKEVHKFTDEELVDLLKKSRQNNVALGITGMLLYKSGKFLQVLEGETDVVEQLFDRIRNDPRHHAFIPLSIVPVKQREFGDWSMAFGNLSNLDLHNVEGYSQALEEDLEFERFSSNAPGARSLLDIFKNTPQLLDF